MKSTFYKLENKGFGRAVRFALVSDLHGGDPVSVVDVLKKEKPDYILMPGDIFECLESSNGELFENSIRMLRESAKIAPTFYSIGNHEDGAIRMWLRSGKARAQMKRNYSEEALKRIRESGAVLLDNEYRVVDGIAIGGLSSGLINSDEKPNAEWLDGFCKESIPKVLLCHHPEYYKIYLNEKDIDLIVSGHAHGGQWRFFGRGFFAPGQGIFPKYTKGVFDDRLVVSTGLQTSWIPRFFNPTEVVFIDLK